MTRSWRVIFWIAAVLLVVGLVLAGAGWLSGASTGRIVNEVFGSKAGLTAQLDAVKTQVLDLLNDIF